MITPGGLVMLDVSQSVEDVTGEVRIDDNQQPIIARRERSSNGSVRGGGVVVLGGLIRNDRTKAESNVPVPGIAFKQSAWHKNRSKLMVLIRPTVMRTPEAAQHEAQKLREDFKGLEHLPADTLPRLPTAAEKPTNKPRRAPLPSPEGS